ncbi:hypothetical protein N7468_000592 [Penicillium chermesinum]|uniref:Aminoglycoside phosphotransferase domain-containing protein n=1 Tax=Penicillium chermesinum TaxID=63820 RepID=A0A9W9U0K1_9EURO|nr:uncharacterized protein N7468_000592 [Penicillium chermesinum]KAJ5249141.1 hypothetical protein N7468_000592 [Penicillium chermesinum]
MDPDEEAKHISFTRDLASGYPQVLNHGDFSKTNILANPDTYEITGIVDWSLGQCNLLFWAVSGIEDDDGLHRENIRSMAEEEGKIGVILRYAFERKADGGPSDVLSISDVMWRMLKAWLNVKTT